MLELWEMRSTPSLPAFPGPLWPAVVAPDRVLPIGQIEMTFRLSTKKWHAKLNCLK